MSCRRAAKVDANQAGIVKKLRKVKGVTVLLDVDDILVGYKGHNFLFEIKDPATACNKSGQLKPDALKPSQVDLLRSWQGHYEVVCSFEEIMQTLNGV